MNVCCVIVTYNPNVQDFLAVLKTIRENTESIIIVDNGSSVTLDIELDEGLYFVQLESNCGISKAQNMGVKKALALGADYIWLSDQDTYYPDDYLEKMERFIKGLESSEVKYSVVGPAYRDVISGKVHPFVKIDRGFKKINPQEGVNDISQLIASGMIIPGRVFSDIGYMREDFFIDWVDFDWCWRSIEKGYKVIGNGSVFVDHSLGDSSVSFLGKDISLHTPFRHYFILRNAVYIALYYSNLSIALRLSIFIKSMIRMLLYTVLPAENKKSHLIAVFSGFLDGVLKRLGPRF